MRIAIFSGTGEGPTEVAAFDAALQKAGVADYNFIHMSSIVPPGAQVQRAQFDAPASEYGHRLYGVMAKSLTAVPAEEAWAALGWSQEGSDDRGIFVEGHAATEEDVRRDVEMTLDAMAASRPGTWGPHELEVAGITCREQPVCAVVVAAYESVGWK